MFLEEKAGTIKGLKISRNSSAIHHLLFANDLLIFGRANFSKACCINSCLEAYCRWFGQYINVSKSSIRFQEKHHSLHCLFHLKNPTLQYQPYQIPLLALPILTGNSKRCAFQFILDKVVTTHLKT
jgi:hypothetical protein